MAIKYYEKYPQRWESPSNDYPQGAFKNLSALGEQDGSYLEKDWLNDQSGFFGALLRNAEMTPNGLVDTAQKSQFYDALLVCARKAVNLGNYYTKEQVEGKIVEEWGGSHDKSLSQDFLTQAFRQRDISILDFGAHPSKSSEENTIAIQSAIDFVCSAAWNQKPVLTIPSGTFLVKNSLTIPSHSVQFAFVGSDTYSSVLHLVEDLDQPFILDEGYMNSYSNFTINGGSFNRDNTNKVAILFKRPTGSPSDIDARLNNMRINRFHAGIRIFGRGLYVEGGVFSVSTWGIELDYPSLGEYIEGEQPVQKDSTGYRSYVFVNNRFHSNLQGGIRNEGINAKKIQCITILNNMLDIGRTLYKGVLRRAISSGNIIDQTPSEAYHLTDGSEDYLIANDVIAGNTDSNRIPPYFIRLMGTHKNYRITNMILKSNRDHGIDIRGDNHIGGVINGITFIDACRAENVFSPIAVVGNNNSLIIDGITSTSENNILGIVRNNSSTNDIQLGAVNSSSNKNRWVGSQVHGIINTVVGLNSSDSFLSLERGGSSYGSVNFSVAGTGGIEIHSAGSINLKPDQGSIRPYTDNVVRLGNSTHTFSDLFLTNQPTVTSDARLKQDINYDLDALMRVVPKLKYCQYRLSGSTALKGDEARVHLGLLAQEVIEAFKSEDLDAFEYGIICYDKWDEVKDADGNVTQEAGDKYSLRYGELQNLFNAYILSKLK